MTQYLKEIVLDFSGGASTQRIVAKQGDEKSRYLKITLLSNGVPVIPELDSRAIFRALKPDGKSVSYTATINSDGTVTVELSKQVLAVRGEVKADISIVSADGAILSTASFFIQVDDAPIGKDAQSESQILVFQELTSEAVKAAASAKGADNVNISAVQTATGADITVIDRTGTPTTVHIDTLMNINSWQDVQNAVRLGLGQNLFPVGYEFTTPDSALGTDITWVVRSHDQYKPANSRLTHSMLLETKYVYSQSNGLIRTVQYDAQEAVYYAADGLAAGTYHFTVANQLWFASDNGKPFQFTLTKAVPVGGQVVVSATHNQTFAGKSVKTYASPYSTAVIETATLAEGSGGTFLGTTNGKGNINHAHRIVFGSDNYAQSAVRQWLISDVEDCAWTPTNKFDRMPSGWFTKSWMSRLPADFLAVVEPAVIPCRTNSVYECASLDGTEFAVNQVYELKDKFFLLSRPEIYGSWDDSSIKDGELLDYYDGLTDAERKKYDAAGNVRYAWLRSPSPSNANLTRNVNVSGSVNSSGASNVNGVVPACIIA